MDSPDWNIMLQGLLSNTNLTAIIKTEVKRERDAENLAQCKKYAMFMWDFSRAKAELVYWSMLLLILTCLAVSTIMYDKTCMHSK
jgi:hypothetical protein